MLETMPKTTHREAGQYGDLIECSSDSGANGDSPRIAPTSPPPDQDLGGGSLLALNR